MTISAFNAQAVLSCTIHVPPGKYPMATHSVESITLQVVLSDAVQVVLS